MYIGIDLGGTNIAAGIVDENGNIIKKKSIPTRPERGFKKVAGAMALLCKELILECGLSESDISSVGVGSPGVVDSERGIVKLAENLKWYDVDLKGEMEKHFLDGINVNIENDANAAAYGEYMMLGYNCDSFIFITLGTGVGGGVIINKEIYRGYGGCGAELGHMTLVHGGEKCTCGKLGCLEAYASVSGLINQTRTAIEKNPSSAMTKAYKEYGEINGKTAFTAAKNGDAAASLVVKNYIEYVADGICSIINIFAPEVLLIGGGISKEGDYLLNPINEYCRKNMFLKDKTPTKIAIAALGNDAGIIGAALTAKKR